MMRLGPVASDLIGGARIGVSRWCYNSVECGTIGYMASFGREDQGVWHVCGMCVA